MAQWSELIRAIAELVKALQWPLVALIVSLFFRHEIYGLLRRVRKFKAWGAEGELTERLDDLEKGTDQIPPPPTEPSDSKGTPLNGPPVPESRDNRTETEKRIDEDQPPGYRKLETEVLRVAVVSPAGAIILLATEIERRLRAMAAWEALDRGAISTAEWRDIPVRHLVRRLEGMGVLGPKTAVNIENFWQVRNLAAHGRGEDEELRRAIEPGLSVWLSLMSREVARIW